MKGSPRRRWEWLKIGLVVALVGASAFLTIWYLFVSDVGFVFPNLFYFPVILSCLWWDRRGVAVAAFLALLLLVSSIASPGTDPVWDDAVRAGTLILIAVVVAELSARRKEITDTLEEKVSERTAQLQARNEELDAFSRTVSHDLVASLATLHGYVEVAKEAAAGDKHDLEMESLDAIGAISMRMAHDIRELLDYARAGRRVEEPEPVDPSHVAGMVVDDLASLLSGGSVEVVVEDGLPDVMVEEVKLKQVLSNLVSNAIRHGAGDKPLRVEIGGRRAGDGVILFVRDDGVGIEREYQDEIFEDFRRMSGGKGEPGLGLGLSIVRRAVEGWGGRVWLESAPGEGSTFYFTAPASTA